MRHLLAAAALLLPLPAFAQSDKLPPANALPYADDEAAAVLTPINAILAAFEAGDAAAVLRHVYPDGRVTASGLPGELRSQPWSKYIEQIRPDDVFQERISNPAIEIDGDIAMVWAPFVVRQKGKVMTCGYDHFDLVRQKGVWKVMNITFSSRTTGCPAR